MKNIIKYSSKILNDINEKNKRKEEMTRNRMIKNNIYSKSLNIRNFELNRINEAIRNKALLLDGFDKRMTLFMLACHFPNIHVLYNTVEDRDMVGEISDDIKFGGKLGEIYRRCFKLNKHKCVRRANVSNYDWCKKYFYKYLCDNVPKYIVILSADKSVCELLRKSIVSKGKYFNSVIFTFSHELSMCLDLGIMNGGHIDISDFNLDYPELRNIYNDKKYYDFIMGKLIRQSIYTRRHNLNNYTLKFMGYDDLNDVELAYCTNEKLNIVDYKSEIINNLRGKNYLEFLTRDLTYDYIGYEDLMKKLDVLKMIESRPAYTNMFVRRMGSDEIYDLYNYLRGGGGYFDEVEEAIEICKYKKIKFVKDLAFCRNVILDYRKSL